MTEDEFRNKNLVRPLAAQVTDADNIKKDVPPEVTQFQVVYALYEDQKTGVLRRLKDTFTDKELAEKAAVDLVTNGWAVQDVFVCNLHAAYAKETTIKKVI